jgi:hypothetical protein
MYTYHHSEDNLWTVGFYSPDGKWHPECDCGTPEEAAKRTAYLNGRAAAIHPDMARRYTLTLPCCAGQGLSISDLDYELDAHDIISDELAGVIMQLAPLARSLSLTTPEGVLVQIHVDDD